MQIRANRCRIEKRHLGRLITSMCGFNSRSCYQVMDLIWSDPNYLRRSSLDSPPIRPFQVHKQFEHLHSLKGNKVPCSPGRAIRKREPILARAEIISPPLISGALRRSDSDNIEEGRYDQASSLRDLPFISLSGNKTPIRGRRPDLIGRVLQTDE